MRRRRRRGGDALIECTVVIGGEVAAEHDASHSSRIVGATVTPGGSGWGAQAHVPALTSLPGYELKAVCTAHAETAKASAEVFGAELAFSDFDDMLAHPDIDLVAVVVRVPLHHELTLKALYAGKTTLCEWPLAANLTEAEELANVAQATGFVRLPDCRRGAIPQYEPPASSSTRVTSVKCSLPISLLFRAVKYVRGTGRLWQSQRKNGHYPLTVAGGHSIDVTRFLVGEFVELSARVTTQTRQWLDSDTGHAIDVDAPDTTSVVARTRGGAEVAMQIATVPTAATGFRLEIYGTAGRLVLTSDSNVSTGPNRLLARNARAT